MQKTCKTTSIYLFVPQELFSCQPYILNLNSWSLPAPFNLFSNQKDNIEPGKKLRKGEKGKKLGETKKKLVSLVSQAVDWGGGKGGGASVTLTPFPDSHSVCFAHRFFFQEMQHKHTIKTVNFLSRLYCIACSPVRCFCIMWLFSCKGPSFPTGY